jgi:hypothetical protein
MPQNIGLKFVKNNSFHATIGQVPKEVIRQEDLITSTRDICDLELGRESESC